MKKLYFLLVTSYCYSQNYPSTTYYTPTEIQSTFNLKLAQQVLEKKQKSYDYNSERIDNYINLVITYLKNADIDESLSQSIQNRYYLEYIKTFYDKKYDLSSNSLTEKILYWLKDGFDYVLKLETEKFINKSDSLRKGVASFTRNYGGYSISLIEEFIYLDKKWVLIKSENNNGYIYYDGNMLLFKRGTGGWNTRPLNYIAFDTALRSYRYTSTYGETTINETFSKITFYDSDKKYVYSIGRYDSNIKP